MMFNTITNSTLESLKVTMLVLLMMVLVDIINVKSKGKLETILQSGRKWKQYIVASLLGAAPGCLGSFAGVSLYIHGMISLGALTGLMLATSGEEQFIILALFPQEAMLLFSILFILGIITGLLTDYFVKKFNITKCLDCKFVQYHPDEGGYKHYFTDHIWRHIIKGHLAKIFFWTFSSIVIIEFGLTFIDLKSVSTEYTIFILLFAALLGLIPESGPHLIIVMLFAKGIIPFSVLFTSAIVQDGHGMLPLLSYSIKDSLKIKLFNFAFGLILGLSAYLIGY